MSVTKEQVLRTNAIQAEEIGKLRLQRDFYSDMADGFRIELEAAESVLLAVRPIQHNWSEGGGGLIVPTWWGFVLYQVPQYGGEPLFHGHYNTLDEAKREADKWT